MSLSTAGFGGIERMGSLELFLEHYIQAKKGPRTKRKVDALLKRRVWELRETHHDCCGQKLQYFLAQEGTQLSVTKIYEILAEKYLLRSRWKKQRKPGTLPVAAAAREVIQMDSVVFGDVFAFTAVDIYSREVSVLLRPSLTSYDGSVFLHHAMQHRFNGHVHLIQTDGGPEFKEHFKKALLTYATIHRLARPYKKNEQAFIESFNRSLRKECLGWSHYKQADLPRLQEEVDAYIDYYHNVRPHLGLHLQPPEAHRLLHI